MAVNIIGIPLTPENTELGGDHIRRNSTGKIGGFQNNGPKIRSRYLRASTGSCHDFCKYGIHNASEAKEKNSTSKRITAALDEGQYPEKISSLAKTVTVSKNYSSLPGKGTNVSTRSSSESKMKPFLTRPLSLPTAEQMSSKRNGNIRKNKKMEARLKNPLEGPSILRNGTVGTEKEMQLAVSFSPKTVVRRDSNKKNGNSEDMKGARLKNRNNARKAKVVQVSSEDVPETTTCIIEPEAENKVDGSAKNGSRTIRSSPSLTLSSEGKIRRHSCNKIQSTKSCASSESKLVRCTRNGIDTTQLPPSPSSSSEKKRLRHPQNRIFSPLSSTMSLSESTLSDESGPISEHNETESKKQTSILKVVCKGKPTRGGISSLECKNRSPRRLHFRQGKVVDLQCENNSPRRLKFRQGRVLGENYNCKKDALRRSFKRREVVLKHHNVVGKKDRQSLFNNVIEETASKLVKTRKSKVKALVGAFETIISLQEAKPVAVTSIR